MTTLTLKITGMTCEHCVRSVTEALLEVPGVDAAKVNLEQGTAVVTYDPDEAGLDDLKEAVEDAGYGVQV